MDYINIRSVSGPQVKKPDRKTDTLVSKIVGKDISTTDPRLLSFLAEKRSKLGDGVSLSEALRNGSVQDELKKCLK